MILLPADPWHDGCVLDWGRILALMGDGRGMGMTDSLRSFGFLVILLVFLGVFAWLQFSGIIPWP